MKICFVFCFRSESNEEEKWRDGKWNDSVKMSLFYALVFRIQGCVEGASRLENSQSDPCTENCAPIPSEQHTPVDCIFFAANGVIKKTHSWHQSGPWGFLCVDLSLGFLRTALPGPIHTGCEHANLWANSLMLASSVDTPIRNSRFHLLAFSPAQVQIQYFGQGAPVEFWSQGGPWAQNLLKIGVFR